jgi:hypothetical protein
MEKSGNLFSMGSGNPENGGVNSVKQQVQFCYKK